MENFKGTCLRENVKLWRNYNNETKYRKKNRL